MEDRYYDRYTDAYGITVAGVATVGAGIAGMSAGTSSIHPSGGSK